MTTSACRKHAAILIKSQFVLRLQTAKHLNNLFCYGLHDKRRCLSAFARFGGHQLIELRVLGEFIGKRYKAGDDLDQFVTGIYIGDIGKLGVRDVQQLPPDAAVRE